MLKKIITFLKNLFNNKTKKPRIYPKGPTITWATAQDTRIRPDHILRDPLKRAYFIEHGQIIDLKYRCFFDWDMLEFITYKPYRDMWE